MKNKYYFFKKVYKEYVVIMKIKGKYKSYGHDKELIKYIKNNDINYVIVDSDFKVSVVQVNHINNYKKYLIMNWIKNKCI
ncbi:unknown [Clostridium sp. CAG:609]|jgi:hypothetical protein|nr:unknown [Clostridium sp. CAG:609]